MHNTCAISHVLLRDTEPWQNGLGGLVQGGQRRILLSLGGHHLITEMFGILLERRQFRQRAVTYQEIGFLCSKVRKATWPCLEEP
jgi:hypothetical protein